MDFLEFVVDAVPPVKNEAKSMLSADHRQFSRVRQLLEAAHAAVEGTPAPTYGASMIGMEDQLWSPDRPRADATNYLGGIGDVLQDKSSRSGLDDLGDLMMVALYANDRQIQEVHYRWARSKETGYRLRFWELSEQ